MSEKLFAKLVGALTASVLAVTAAAAQSLPPPPAANNPPVATEPAKPPAKPKTAKPKPKPKSDAPLSLTNPPNNTAPRPPADVGKAPAAPPPPAQSAGPPPAPYVPKPGQPALNARQVALVERVSHYLSNLRTLVGEFKQIAPNGQQSAGDFYLLKPGKVRFDYNPPSPTELIADGRSVAIRDRNLASQDIILISQTPLRFLLADRIDLLRDTNLVAVFGDNVFVTVVIEERQITRGTYRVMLMFDARTTELRQWVVTDPQGLDTTVAVYNLDTQTRPDPELFKIDYTRYSR